HERQQPALRRRVEADVRESERLEDAPGDARLELHALRGADSPLPPLGQLARLASTSTRSGSGRPRMLTASLAFDRRRLAFGHEPRGAARGAVAAEEALPR